MHLDLGMVLETLDKLIDAAHLIDALLVLKGGLLDFEVYLSGSQLLLILLDQALLLSLDGLLLTDRKIVGGLALDLCYSLFTMGFNELDHASKNLSGSLHFLGFINLILYTPIHFT